MKNPTLLLTPDAVTQYMGDLFRTDTFRKSLAEPNGYIARLVNNFASKPRVIFDMSDAKLERAHFYTWMGASPRRDYQSDAIHDLYYHHEMWHSVTMPYYPEMPFESWKHKMTENEFYSSLESEAFVYFALPGLREQTFSFPIWVDRFLQKDGMSDLSRADLYKLLCSERRRAMAAPLDAVEQHVSDYVESNEAWSSIWKNSYNAIETHMYQHLMSCTVNPKESIAKHLNFFDSHRPSAGGVPFQEEAVAFQQVYQRLFTPAP